MALIAAQNSEVAKLPSQDECLRQIQKILHSAAFRNASMLQHLLQYLAAKAYNSESESLKEYTIGVDVFAKPTCIVFSSSSENGSFCSLRRNPRAVSGKQRSGIRNASSSSCPRHIRSFCCCGDACLCSSGDAVDRGPVAWPNS